MKFVSTLIVATWLFVASSTAFTRNPNSYSMLKAKKIIVELTIPGHLNAERIVVPGKKNHGVDGGGGIGISELSPETLKATKVWSFSYNLSLLKREKDSVILNLRLSYEADGKYSINKLIEIKQSEITEVEYQDGIKLRAYFE